MGPVLPDSILSWATILATSHRAPNPKDEDDASEEKVETKKSKTEGLIQTHSMSRGQHVTNFWNIKIQEKPVQYAWSRRIT